MSEVIDELAPLRGRRILITGAGGMLGRAFNEVLEALGDGVTVHALARESLDVTNAGAVAACAALQPDIILHCAALVNADLCQREPDLARNVILEGSRHIAALACQTGARVFYPQSFLIFDGREQPAREHTPAAPAFAYGAFKLEAERLLLKEVPGTLAVRMAGFFGGDEKDKNFVGKFVREIERLVANGVNAVEVGDRVWQPTYTVDLARNSLLLIARERTGIYNMGSVGEATFYDVARLCVEELGHAERLTVMRVPSKFFDDNETVRRPSRLVLANVRLEDEGLNRQRRWDEALREYLRRPYFDRIRHRRVA